MLKYEAGFSVLKFDGKSRNCSKGLYFEDVKSLLSAGMNPCDYAYTSEVINKLKRLLSEEICEFEWGGGERTWFLSEPELTLVTDNFGWHENVEVPTSQILELMELRKHLMDNWSKDEVTSLIRDSFEKIIKDKSKYIDDEEASRYKIFHSESGFIVLMVLLEEDFEVTPIEYCRQLKFNDNFFPPENLLT
ncbi:MAG: hypothetical protein KDE33_27070 [Bacteroidetes bacterium]|nr:hypothetical protein [Bacteroidota bacterium]